MTEVARSDCLRRNLAVRHGISEGRQSTPDAVIHWMTSLSIATAENRQYPDWIRCIRLCSGISQHEVACVLHSRHKITFRSRIVLAQTPSLDGRLYY